MKNPILIAILVASASCSPYYVGRKPLDSEPAMLQAAATQAEQITSAAQAERGVTAPGQTGQPNQGIGQGPDVVGAELPMSQDDWGSTGNAVSASNANMPAETTAYGFDGKPIEDNVAQLHQLESDDSTRGNLVEWYATAIADKEALQGSLKFERDRVDALVKELATFQAVAAIDANEIATLKAELVRQKTEREDLEARLVTAQIRRLESEKLLLEDRLRNAETEEAKPTPSRMGTVATAGPGQ